MNQQLIQTSLSALGIVHFLSFSFEMGRAIEFDINKKIRNKNLEKTRKEFLNFIGKKV